MDQHLRHRWHRGGDWHLTNLRQYTGLTASNPTTTIDGFTMEPLGQGSGLRGLPNTTVGGFVAHSI